MGFPAFLLGLLRIRACKAGERPAEGDAGVSLCGEYEVT